MTNMRHLIEMLIEKCPVEVDERTIIDIFEAIHKKEWKYFCSYMGDYDHPSERVEADDELEGTLNRIAKNSDDIRRAIDFELETLDDTSSEIGRFYSAKFHHMGDDFEGK